MELAETLLELLGYMHSKKAMAIACSGFM